MRALGRILVIVCGPPGRGLLVAAVDADVRGVVVLVGSPMLGGDFCRTGAAMPGERLHQSEGSSHVRTRALGRVVAIASDFLGQGRPRLVITCATRGGEVGRACGDGRTC